MSIDAVRHQFTDAGLNVSACYLEYDKDGQQIISVTGWHADQTPFAIRTAPFSGDPVSRAQQLAFDLIQTHSGGTVAAPGKNLADGVGDILSRLKDRSEAAHTRLGASVDNMNKQVDDVEKMAADIDAAAAKIQGMLSAHTNGGPA